MEEYLFALNGKNGQLYVTEECIVIERSGMLSFMTHGLSGRKEIPICNIKALQVKEGNMWTNGFIQFTILGGVENRGGLFAATSDENTIMYEQKDNKIVAQIKEFVQTKMHRATSAATAVIAAPSAADEIFKLKQLVDAGVLTSEEFSAKKRQLLCI